MKDRIFAKRDIDNSFFLINEKKQIIFFNVDGLKKLKVLNTSPRYKQPLKELIPKRYENSFAALVNHCFAGNSITLKRNLRIRPFTVMQLTAVPICISSKIPYILLTILCDNESHVFDDYSHYTSHQLRAPLCNILSLSSPQLKTMDQVKTMDLLGDINRQAKKMDAIIVTLNSLLKNDKQPASFKCKNVKPVIDHIVLVDDDPLVNKMHTMMLSKYNGDNKTLVSFNDPVSAIDYVINNIPDLLLLDLNMPGMDGFQFLEKLKRHAVQVDVIIVSSSIDHSERIKASSYDFVKDFLSKPLTYEKIEKILA